MNRGIVCLVAAWAVGCGGQPFTDVAVTSSVDGNSPSGDSGVGGSGGATLIDNDAGTGGSSAGGAVGGTGGIGGGGGSVVEDSGAGGAAVGDDSSTRGGAASTGGAGGEPSAGGSGVGGAPVDACVLVTHDNGLGQTWQDCVPLGTYNEAQAVKACEASGAATCVTAIFCASSGNVDANVVRGVSGSQIYGVWGYKGVTAGIVSTNGTVCYGPGSTNRSWD